MFSVFRLVINMLVMYNYLKGLYIWDIKKNHIDDVQCQWTSRILIHLFVFVFCFFQKWWNWLIKLIWIHYLLFARPCICWSNLNSNLTDMLNLLNKHAISLEIASLPRLLSVPYLFCPHDGPYNISFHLTADSGLIVCHPISPSKLTPYTYC